MAALLSRSEGVYRDRRCSLKPAELNHAVILVGWGTDKKTHEDYWIVKNSEYCDLPRRLQCFELRVCGCVQVGHWYKESVSGAWQLLGRYAVGRTGCQYAGFHHGEANS